MSSLERLPSDETDDGNVRLTSQEPEPIKPYNPGIPFHSTLRDKILFPF